MPAPSALLLGGNSNPGISQGVERIQMRGPFLQLQILKPNLAFAPGQLFLFLNCFPPEPVYQKNGERETQAGSRKNLKRPVYLEN